MADENDKNVAPKMMDEGTAAKFIKALSKK